MAQLITDHVILDHCWACKSKTGLHNHHIIPQAYGGVDGFQVTLCGAHHTYIHTKSFNWQASFPDIVADESGNKYSAIRLWYLIRIISNARREWNKTHPEKELMLNLVLDVERARKFRRIQKVLGASSQQKALNAMVDKLYDALAK